VILHVEYAERSINYGILFIFSLFYEHSNLEYEHVSVEYRFHQAKYLIHIHVAASQEYVNTYVTRRTVIPKHAPRRATATSEQRSSQKQRSLA